MNDTWDGSDSNIPLYYGRKLTNYDNYDRLQSFCTHAAFSYSPGISLKTSACYFLKETIDTQQHDEVFNDVIENLEYGNMLVAEINVNQEVFL